MPQISPSSRTPHRRRWAAALVLATTIVAAVGPVTGAQAAVPRAKGPDLSDVTLRVAVTSPTSSASQDIRLASKAFEGTPYTIQWSTFTTSTAALEALNAGAVDLAVDIQSTTPLSAQASAKTPWTKKTAPFRLVAAALPPPAGGNGVYVRTDGSVSSVKDLKGKKVAYTRGSGAQYYWVVTAKENKLKPGAVEEVQLATVDGRAALLSGGVDAMVTVRRVLLGDISSGKVEPLADADLEVPEYKVTVARTAALDDKKTAAAIGDYLARLAKSKRWLPKHTKEAEAIFAQSARLSPTDAAAAVAELAVTLLPLDAAVVAELQQQDRVFADAGVNPSDPKVGIIVDRRFDSDITG